MSFSDKGSGQQLVENLQRMCNAVWPCRVLGACCKCSELLKCIHISLAKTARRLTAEEKWGLANSLHAEFSGLAGLVTFKRLDASWIAFSKSNQSGSTSLFWEKKKQGCLTVSAYRVSIGLISWNCEILKCLHVNIICISRVFILRSNQHESFSFATN